MASENRINATRVPASHLSGSEFESALSQEEIKSLLRVAGTDSTTHSGMHDLLNSRKLNAQRLPMLEGISEEFAHRLTGALTDLTRSPVEVTFKDVKAYRFVDYMDLLPNPTSINAFETPEWEGKGLFTLDTTLVYSLVHSLLGGGKHYEIRQGRHRPYTTIEKNILERFVTRTLAEFESVFQPIFPVSFKLKSMNTDPRMSPLVPAETSCLVIQLNVLMHRQEGLLEFLLPFPVLERVQDTLSQPKLGHKYGEDPLWRSHLEEELRLSSIELQAELDPITLPLGEVVKWKVGDQIQFEEGPDSSLALNSGGKCVLSGLYRQKGGKVIIKVDKLVQTLDS